MRNEVPNSRGKLFELCLVLAVAAVVVSLPASSSAQELPDLQVIGVAPDGTETPLDAYRWLVEEDKTYHVQTDSLGAALSNVFDPNWAQGSIDHPGGETLSTSFHQSYMPVVGKGCVGFGDLIGGPTQFECTSLDPGVLDSGKHYYVSVVPRSGYSIGGASFKGGDAVTVYVNQYPIPTAQITILVFNDNNPINNAPDLPGETPGTGEGQTDMSGFQIIVEDAGGRWGASAGVMSQDAFGNPLCGGVCQTGPDGRLTIENLAPGKYGISAVPPAGSNWQQTSTIEGTKVIDAWVKANEPPFFGEFGPPGFHVFIGFVKPFDSIPGGGTATLEGKIVNQHLSRPPDYAFYNGACFGHTTPWVGLNDMSAGIGTGIYAAATDEDCNFSIPNVPAGNYQLVVWDNNMDLVFAFKGISVISDGLGGLTCVTPTGCELGEVPVFQWFVRQEHRVFDDGGVLGLWEPGEPPSALETGFTLRWRDGTVYQGNVSDGTGAYTFDQIFPFFSWLVAEVDFVRLQATGVTVVVDNGGPIDDPGGEEPPLDGSDWTFGKTINPQDQTNPLGDGPPYETDRNRYETGPVLTQGFQGFLGQTNAFLWGKRHYPDGENGGISGIVFYAVTRAEDDPELAAAEVWEPGIPGVTVNLYDATGTTLLNSTTTDSWDDSIPTGCKWGNGATGAFEFSPDGETFYPTDCYDGLRNFNQARPAVFDGGYAFDAICADGLIGGECVAGLTSPMPVGDYVVEVIPPPGYEILKPEDKNVDFGDEYPAPELLPAPCVGADHLIPPYLTLFPDEQVPSPFAWATGSYVPTYRPLCDKKVVTLEQGGNAAADFFLFTEVPVSARGFGFILDDTAAEFNPNSPQFGEKYAPPFVPVTIRDWTGRIIGKTLSDQFGRYNFLAPSTITTNLPAPSGMSPNMLTTCMNDPGDDADDPNWNQLYSTFCYTFQYMPGVTTYLDTPIVPVAAFTGPEQFPLDCEYPDGTPRIFSVDVQTNGVGGGPYIPTRGNNDSNRVIDGDQTITITSLGTISVPNPNYCNPAAGPCPGGADLVNKTVTRDNGFGTTPGTISLGEFPVVPWIVWTDATITVDIGDGTPLGPLGGRQLTVTRGDNDMATVVGVTVQMGLRQGSEVVLVSPSSNLSATPITDAITDTSTAANALVLVAPGDYSEMVIMSKPVQLQGWGEGSTTINAIKAPFEKLEQWRSRVDGLIAGGDIDLLPGQEVGAGDPEPVTLWTEEGAGVLVLAKASGNLRFERERNRDARVDGFTIKSADTGGGVLVNGYADYLQISNNRISNNTGFYGGGIRVGHPTLVNEEPDGAIFYTDGENDFVSIHHNQVVFNGGQGGAGGGISMCAGSDSYRVTENWVCGNFTARDGAGIGHIGVSDGVWIQVPDSGPQNQRVWVLDQIPLIEDNNVIFNESFFQGATVSGGGIFIGGAPPLTPGALSPGAGNVQVNGNLIQGNSAGAGDGGGLRLALVNGQDVEANPSNTPKRNGNQGSSDPPPWYAVDVFNNMIVNNVAGLAGGGISMQDAVNARIVNNTIANNDSLATAGDAFSPGNPNQSNPQPGAGIVSRGHTGALAGIADAAVGTFSDPSDFADNIIWQNRQFFFKVADGTPGDPANAGVWGLCPDIGGTIAGLGCPSNLPVYDDLGVIGAGALDCDPIGSCILTGGFDPQFVAEYVNGDRSSVLQPEINTAIQAPPAFDEGGNFIKPQFGPLSLYDDVPAVPPTLPDGLPGTLFGDYHIQSGSPAVDLPGAVDLTGSFFKLTLDFDGQSRPFGGGVDIGADEIHPDPEP